MAKQPTAKRFYFKKLEVARKFASTSKKFGFDESVQKSYDDDLLNFIEEWEGQGYVEIHDPAFHGRKAIYPLAKDSNLVEGSSPEYTGLYHARLLSDGSDDPLLIVTFQGMIVDQASYEKAVIEAMIDHDWMFLSIEEKKRLRGEKLKAAFKARRQRVRETLEEDE